MSYRISSDKGIIRIESPVTELIPLRKELARLYREEVVSEARRLTEKGVGKGIISRVAEKFNTSPTAIKKSLEAAGITIGAIINEKCNTKNPRKCTEKEGCSTSVNATRE